jgi:hypothetical protein
MALTLSRWSVAVALACAGIGAVLLPPPAPKPGRQFVPGQATRVQRLTGQLERAKEKLKIVALGDSVLAIARRAPLPAGGKPTVLDLGSATPEERRGFSQSVNAWWPDTGLDSSVAVALVLGGESGKLIWLEQHMLPASGDGRTCVTLVPTQTWKLASRMPGPRDLEYHFATELGPCLFMATYGRPGPRLEQWLGGPGLDFVGYFNPSGRSIAETVDLPDDLPTQYSIFDVQWAMYGTMPLGITCLTGSVDACAAGIAPADSSSGAIRPGFHAPTVSWRAPFGSLTSSFLADLQREIGPARFREFWHAQGTVEQAIHQATGLSLGEWAHRWAMGRRNAVRAGPLPEQRSVFRVAGLTMLLLGLAVMYSVRRTVR